MQRISLFIMNTRQNHDIIPAAVMEETGHTLGDIAAPTSPGASAASASAAAAQQENTDNTTSAV